MILVIDNYDSFTFNLVQYFGELGAELKVVRNDQITVAQVEHLVPAGTLDPDTIHTPGIYVDDLVQIPGPRSPIGGAAS